MDSTDKLNILIVDDRPENLMALEAILEETGQNLIKAHSGNEALELLLEYDFAVVLLDVQMPDMDGFETAAIMRSVERSRNIPIIFVTALSKEETQVFKGYEAGAVDYILKPLNPDILLAKVNVFLELARQRQQLEKSTQMLKKIILKQEEYKRIIEEQNLALRDLAIRDGLTNIYNRRHFQELMGRELLLAERHRRGVCLLMIDLDNFKLVNDTCGHPFGDFVLKSFVGLIQDEIRASDILARYGGEEFVLLLPDIHADGAMKVAEKIRKKAETHVYRDGNHERVVTISIGIHCCNPQLTYCTRDLLRFADKALYQAKDGGRNRVVVFITDPTMEIWEANRPL